MSFFLSTSRKDGRYALQIDSFVFFLDLTSPLANCEEDR